MKSVISMFLILFIALTVFSCDQQTTSPVLSLNEEENAQYTEAQAMPGSIKNDFVGIDKREVKLPMVPKCIILQELPDWPTANFVIEQVNIQDDIITFILSYSGGCKPHDFQLVSTYFPESDLFERVTLAPKFHVFHNNNDDPCDQWITEVRQFDLSPLKEIYFKMYGTRCSTIEINLVDAISQDSKLTYQFCPDNDIIPPGDPLPPINIIPKYIQVR